MSDLINRRDAINAISTWDKFGVDERNRVVRWYEGLEPYVKLRDVVWAIEKLPSAQRKGKWILHEGDGEGAIWGTCSCCGMHQCAGELNFCPNCGASMVRGEEDD